jgi:hypothetical protein
MKRESNKLHRAHKAAYKPVKQEETVKEYLIANVRTRGEDYITVDETTDFETELENCLEFNRWSKLDIVWYER